MNATGRTQTERFAWGGVEWRLSDVGCLSSCGRFEVVPDLRWGGFRLLDKSQEGHAHAYHLRAIQEIAETRLGNERGAA
jgi:hypothetical protein